MKTRWSFIRFILFFTVTITALSCGGGQPEMVRIMTYNLHHCEGEDGVYDVMRIAGFMRDIGADIILCQEVDRGYSDRSGMDHQPEMLAEFLGFHFHYGPNIGETYGNLILSPYPIDSAENIPLPNPEDIEPRGVIVATITIGGQPFTILDTHLSAFSAVNREEQVVFLRKMLKDLKSPVVFGADFNTRPSQQLKPLLDNGFLVSSRSKILGLEEGIDDILVSADLRGSVMKGEVVENIYSDHPAFWIDIETVK